MLTIKLYKYGEFPRACVLAARTFDCSRQSYIRQRADDLAAEYGLRQGEGHVAVLEDGQCIDKLDLQP